jgi:hypothetical protein
VVFNSFISQLVVLNPTGINHGPRVRRHVNAII